MKMKENAVARNRNDVALENNFMFTTVMKNKKACIRLLEAIFGDEHRIADIRYARHPEAEKSILSDPMRRGVRLDVYFDDGKTVYDIELQRTSITDLAERARLYSSSMDIAMPWMRSRITCPSTPLGNEYSWIPTLVVAVRRAFTP